MRARYGAYISTRQLRRVWAAVTKEPQITVRALATRLGLRNQAGVAIALRTLRDAGYIDYADHATGRTILVPFIAIKRGR